jgi:Tfp pilus assembly protein PilX
VSVKSIIGLLRDEQGSILVIGLIMLAFLTIIGIAATRTTEIEIKVAGNDEYHKIAFYSADSGIYTTPKLISAAIDNAAVQAVASGSYTPDSGTFYREVLGFDAWDSATDVQYVMGDYQATVDVNRTHTQNLPGGGAEFASGAEGIGVGSAGGVAIFYDIDSFGTGPDSAQSRITAVYRKVVGVAGGM